MVKIEVNSWLLRDGMRLPFTAQQCSEVPKEYLRLEPQNEGDHNLITKIRDESQRVRLGGLGERRELHQWERGPPSIFLHTYRQKLKRGLILNKHCAVCQSVQCKKIQLNLNQCSVRFTTLRTSNVFTLHCI